ncbi:hypothetical protein [Flavobacterium sp. AG291]|uniref:hypothetical protein n=1 Tax=Flavobacterium sp. AG291 TaxID=2184000 RepID=UPI000E2D346A|nr:hypothetical protein [Flavobacterium sp. AG291]RDI13148.1 hypothetical protein DEU42_10358 [Flavobacterium sp. AG291]
MEQILSTVISFFLVIGIISFLVVFVMAAAVKISQPNNFFNEFIKYRINKYALPLVIISFLMIFTLKFTINKMEREKISNELSISKSLLYINGIEITNDSLLKDIQDISKTSSRRNTGATEINLVIKNGSKINHVKLLRSFEDSTKYWVSSNENGIGCFGEVNTKHLSNYK